MGLDIEMRIDDKSSHIHWSYHTIHILRGYACEMLGLPNDTDSESNPKAKQEFPNLIWHNDAEGYYVGTLPTDYNEGREWSEDSQIWVGSIRGLYKELQKVSAHMIANKYEGDAKEVLEKLLQMFQEVEYSEDNDYYAYITFH